VLAEQRQALLADRPRLDHVRRELGSVSTFMKFLKQHIARKANAEEDVTGHFFEQRFWSAALLSERAVLAAMVYIDLNPVRALIAQSIEDIRDAGVTERLALLQAGQIALDDDLTPLVSGLTFPLQPVRVTLRAYLALLQVVIDAERGPPPDSMEARWQRDVASLHRKQRAYGSDQQLRAWGEARNWKRPGTPLVA
jgi:hypothetical protein